MKNETLLYKIIATLLLFGLLPALSCSDDELVRGGVECDGRPVTVSLGYDYGELVTANVMTRGHESISKQVNDMFVFIFSRTGILRTKYFFATGQNSSSTAYSTDGDGEATIDRTNCTISNIKTYSMQAKIFLVANSRSHIGEGDALFDQLTKVESVDDLLQVIETESANEFSNVVMAGRVLDGNAVEAASDPYAYVNDHNSESTVYINTSGNVVASDLNSCKAYLVPTMSRVSFNINCNVKNDANYATFTPTSWQVVNLPKQSYILDNGVDKEPETQSFFNSDASGVFESKFVSHDGSDDESNAAVRSFSFYTQPRSLEGEEGKSYDSYQDRVANAPATATYLIIKGNYVGKSMVRVEDSKDVSTEKRVTADVTYKVYLGDFRNGRYNDYNVLRDYHYIYDITIEGVDEISVKVFTPTDRYDADGNILVTDPNNYFLADSHYAQTVIKFSRQEIKEAFARNTIGYTISTPYGNVTRTTNDIKSFCKSYLFNEPLADWLEFRLVLATEDPNTPQMYPGTTSSQKFGLRRMLSLLYNHLDDNYYFNNNDVAYLTVYINEFYYDYEPGSTTKLANWRDFVNTSPRRFLLYTKYNQNGSGSSSVTEAAIHIQQKSIQTIYTTDKSYDSACPVGWGIEYFEEDFDKLGQNGAAWDRKYTPQQSKDYGRQNMLTYLSENGGLGSVDFSSMVSPTTGYVTSAVDVAMACIQRNRDLNGNGKIDTEEVRWYLPAINQYVRTNVGMYGIEQDAHLLTPSMLAVNNTMRHYISSSGKEFPSDQVMWAEEGFSTSSNANSYEWTKGRVDVNNIRCARNLGHNVEKAKWYTTDDYDYSPVFKSEDDNMYNRLVDLAYLNVSSTRTVMEASEISGDVKPFSYNNRPARKFLVKNKDIMQQDNSGTQLFNTELAYDYIVNQNISLCGYYFDTEDDYGWRLPTISELAIINFIGNTNFRMYSDNYLSRTHYQYSNTQVLGMLIDYNKSSAGDSSYKTGGIPYGNGYACSIRCVKDIP